MRVVESFELTLSGGDLAPSNPAADDRADVDGRPALSFGVPAGKKAPDQAAAADPHDGIVPEAIRLLLTFGAAERLHLPEAVVAARFDPDGHRFVVLFEDDVRREEVAFPVELFRPADGLPDPEARASVVDMIRHFDRIVVVGLSSASAPTPAEASNLAPPAPAAVRPDQQPMSPFIVVFGDVPLAIKSIDSLDTAS